MTHHPNLAELVATTFVYSINMPVSRFRWTRSLLNSYTVLTYRT